MFHSIGPAAFPEYFNSPEFSCLEIVFSSHFELQDFYFKNFEIQIHLFLGEERVRI